MVKIFEIIKVYCILLHKMECKTCSEDTPAMTNKDLLLESALSIPRSFTQYPGSGIRYFASVQVLHN